MEFPKTAERVLERIEVTKQPDKTSYYIGDQFDTSGMIVTAYYDDGTSEAVTDYTVTPNVMTLDTTRVTVNYQNKTAEIPVTVRLKPISSAELSLDAPVKYEELDTTVTIDGSNMTAQVEWFEGDGISGQAVTGTAKAGQVYTARITLTAGSDYEFTDDFTAKLNGSNISVLRFGNTVTIVKTFAATEGRILERIEVTKQPDQTRYSIGESFNKTGMEVTAYYEDGTFEIVTDYTVTPDVMAEDTTFVTINYGGKSAAVRVEVKQWYRVTINGGTSEYGQYEEGDIVTITASTSEGQHFTGWTVVSGDIVLADADANETTFIMPAGDVTIRANFEDHIYADDGDCTTPVLCETCGVVVIPAKTHQFGDFTANGDGTHTSTCQNDGCTKTTAEDCSGGSASYFHKAVCDICGGEYGELLKDITLPEGEITVGKNVWKTFLNKITFGLFFKDTQSVQITATDDSYQHAGYTDDKAASIAYYLVNGEMTLEAVEALEEEAWTGDQTAFDIEPNHQYVIYVKITDHAGNVTYLSSDGIVLDAEPPKVFGIEEGKTYCGDTKVWFEDDAARLNVNGLISNVFPGFVCVLHPVSGRVMKYEITVTDKAGNVSSYTVYLNETHTFTTYVYDNNAICEKDGTETAICECCGAADHRKVEGTKLPHTMTHHDAVEATCSKVGHVEYWSCATCFKNYDSEDGSKMIPNVTTPIDPDNHNLVHYEKKEATCTEAGHETYDACTYCNYTTYQEIPAFGHIWNAAFNWSDDSKTCGATFTCEHDKTHLETVNDIEVTQKVMTEPTCTEMGVTKYTATVTFAGETYTESKEVTDIPVFGHSWNAVFHWSADGRTCSVTFTCAYDETHVETVEEAEVTPEVTTEPTCTEMGVTTYTVAVTFAGETYTENKEVTDVPVLGHSWNAVFHWSDDGKTCGITFTCEHDETHVETMDNVEATPEVTTVSTCTEMGVTTYTVSVTFAGETYTASKEITDVPTLDHAYEDGKCTICDAKDPDYKPEISSPDTSDENGFMLWCVLFLAFGSMLSAVMYSRKRRN